LAALAVRKTRKRVPRAEAAPGPDVPAEKSPRQRAFFSPQDRERQIEAVRIQSIKALGGDKGGNAP
jgi:hypothetical protein